MEINVQKTLGPELGSLLARVPDAHRSIRFSTNQLCRHIGDQASNIKHQYTFASSICSSEPRSLYVYFLLSSPKNIAHLYDTQCRPSCVYRIPLSLSENLEICLKRGFLQNQMRAYCAGGDKARGTNSNQLDQ